MKKKNIVLIFALIVIIAICMIIGWYFISISAVNKNDENENNVNIEMGTGTSKIAQQLKDAGVIRSSVAFKIYVKLNKINSIQAGEYKISKNMNVKEITELLQTGKVAKEGQISITFLEGKNMRWIATKIAEETNNTEDEVYELLEYINSLISKYWFITDDIKNKDIYYSLEGYLYPDTYQFESKDIKVSEIFEVLLNQMENKLENYKEEIENSKYSIHELLTVASIIENEAIYDKDRKNVGSVIYNRLNSNMAIQSDVTTYYAFKIDMGSRDLYASEINTYNQYNTRGPNMEGKLPVGPISTVSLSSIEAAIEPSTTSYLYFVADKNGNVYFTRTYSEHTNKVNELKNSGLWIEF
jgi:UPF0755 protein